MKMKKFIVLFTIMALFSPLATQAQVFGQPQSQDTNDTDSPEWDDRAFYNPYITEQLNDTMLRANSDTLMKHIRILASSQYEGRMAGSQAYLDAAEYCANVLASYGVKPFEGSWNKFFEVEYNEIENCNFNTYINDNDTRTRYVLGRDYVCSSMTGRGYVDAPVVFCGYGIDLPAYNEYAKVDVRGKIVLCISGTPDFLPSRQASRFATMRDKAEVAIKHGAVGLVCINISESCRPNEVQHQAYCGEGSHQMTFPVVQPTQDMGAALLADERMTLDSVMEVLASAQEPQSFHLLKRFEININAKYRPNATTCNVVGVLPGYDDRMKGEYIVVGAHLDHVGIQGSTCLFPGADDNASGVAALLETARLISSSAPEKIEYNKRSIIFVLFSGSELQHLGSSIFVSNFSKLSNIECFINAECIGAGDSINVMGGKRFPSLWKIAEHNDTVYPQMLYHGEQTLPKGDAAAFAQIGIPSLVFTHYLGNHHAHVPSDISENIERDIMTKNVSLMAQVIYELSLGDYQGRSFKSKRYKFDE